MHGPIAAEIRSRRAPSASICAIVGGGSALLWGRAIFSYGDTVLNRADEQGQTWHHNSFSFTSDRRGDDGIGPLDPLIVGRAALTHDRAEDFMQVNGA